VAIDFNNLNPVVALPMQASTGGAVRASAPSIARTSLVRHIGGGLEDTVLVLLAILLFPLGILLIGTPIALCVRVVLEIARRL
jgi:hypothetical protein